MTDADLVVEYFQVRYALADSEPTQAQIAAIFRDAPIIGESDAVELHCQTVGQMKRGTPIHNELRRQCRLLAKQFRFGYDGR